MDAYVPPSSEWFRFSEDFVERATVSSNHVHFDDSSSDRPLLLRAGTILPIFGAHSLPSPLNTDSLRRAPIELWVLPTLNGTAQGELFFDDGDSIDTVEKGSYNYYTFTFNKCHLTIDTNHSGYHNSPNNNDQLRIASINFAVPNLRHQDLQSTLDNSSQTLKSVLVGHLFKVETNIDLLENSKKSHLLSVLTTASKECVFH